jgi:hypothetical protein
MTMEKCVSSTLFNDAVPKPCFCSIESDITLKGKMR